MINIIKIKYKNKKVYQITILKNRLKKIFSNIGKNIDLIVILNSQTADPNFYYLTGFTSGLFENNILLVERNGIELITDRLEFETALEQKIKNMKIKSINKANELEKYLKQKLSNKIIGINFSFLPIAYFRYLKQYKPKKIIDVGKAFMGARLVKDEKEIENIRIANEITKKAFKKIQQYFKTGITEKELAATFEYLMRKNNASEEAFETIVSFDKNSALPHHFPDNTKLKENSIVLIDAGAKYNNYCADITQTFIFKPNKNSDKYKKIIEMYNIVKQAQQIGLKNAKENANGKEVHNAVNNFINSVHKGKYNGKFIHSLGHSIGIETHDGPGFSNQNNILKENMIISDEPGIYINGFGGVRIENDVLIKKNKSVFL